MHVLVEARALTSPSSGVGVYVRELLQHLSGQGVDVHAIATRKAIELPSNITKHTVPLAHPMLLSRWLNKTVPKKIRELSPDVVHFTKAAMPSQKVAPTIVTIYDVIPLLMPGSQQLVQRWYWPRALAHAAKMSDHILTISNASKHDIVTHLQVSPGKITVTPLAIDRRHFTRASEQEVARVRARHGISGPYILFVGRIDRRKNLPGLVRSFARIAGDIPHRLVVAGRSDNGRRALVSAMHASGIGERIQLIGSVSYKDLPALYSGADLLAWPSVYEGWGFPPQEAMSCGTPVIVSDGGALPEVVGDAGVIIPFAEADLRARLTDADFEQRFAAEMLTLLQNASKRALRSKRGITQSRRRTWTDVAAQTRAAYERTNEAAQS